MISKHIVKGGESLSLIAKQFNIPWRSIWKANPGIKDPNLIHPGQKLNIPTGDVGEKKDVSLKRTLPPEGGAGIGDTDKKGLPTGSIDQLDLLRMSLKDVAGGAYSKAIGTGLETVTGGLEEAGAGVEGMSGNIMSRIINFVEEQSAKPIEKKFETMEDIITSIQSTQKEERATARSNMGTLISTGAITELDDESLENLALTAGIPAEQLKAIQISKQANSAVVDSYVKGIESGKMSITSVPADARDDVITKVNWGKVPESGSGKSDDVKVRFSQDDINRLVNVGLTPDEIKSVQTDIQEAGIEAAISGSGMDDKQATALREVMSGLTTTQIEKEKEKKKLNYPIDFWFTAAREAFDANKEITENEFITKIEKEFKDMGDKDKEAAKKAFRAIQDEVSKKKEIKKQSRWSPKIWK